MKSLVAMLTNGEVQGQVYAAGALTRMAADPVTQEQIVAAGAIPHLITIMKDNVGAAPAAAGDKPCKRLGSLSSWESLKVCFPLSFMTGETQCMALTKPIHNPLMHILRALPLPHQELI